MEQSPVQARAVAFVCRTSRRVLTLLSPLLLWSASALADVNPVGQWKLDEGTGSTSADASGHGATATLSGATWVAGRVGPNALNYPVATATANASGAGALADLYLTGLTVSAWIKPISAGGGGKGRIVDKDFWFFYLETPSSIGFKADQFATATAGRISTSNLTLNTWQHVTATWDGSTSAANIHLYINGVLRDGTATNGAGAPSSDAAEALTIGNRISDLARRFDGSIDEVRVYNRVLTLTEIQALADATVPGAPSGLTATPASSSQINLSWTAATDNVGVTGYLVERCTGAACSSYAQVATPAGTTYNDPGLTASTTYRYRVRATDANTNLGAYSSVVNATTAAGGDATAPSVPTGVTTTPISSTQIDVSWTASTDNVAVTGYLVERCAGASCTTFAQVGTPAGTIFNDSGLTASTTYRYQVRAKDAVPNYSGYSSIVNGTTPGTLAAPTGLIITAMSSTEIDLSWSASAGATSYSVERCQGASCSSFAQVGTPTLTVHNDTGRTASTSYSYRVRALSSGNQSGYSNTVTQVTAAAGVDCN
jgi:fibronectin type 3 domain-containing protein